MLALMAAISGYAVQPLDSSTQAVQSQLNRGAVILSQKEPWEGGLIVLSIESDYTMPAKSHPSWPNRILIGEKATLSLWMTIDSKLRKVSTAPVGFWVPGWTGEMVRYWQVTQERLVIDCQPPTVSVPYACVFAISKSSSRIEVVWQGLGQVKNSRVGNAEFSCTIDVYTSRGNVDSRKKLIVR